MKKTKKINGLQSYDYEISEERFGSSSCSIDYHFSGTEWERLWKSMKEIGAIPAHMMIFAGAYFSRDGICFAGEFKKNIAIEKYIKQIVNTFGKNVNLTHSKNNLVLPCGKKRDPKNNNDSIKIFINGVELTSTDWDEQDDELIA